MSTPLENLPEPLRSLLLCGGEGAAHLARCSRLAAEAGEAGQDGLAEALAVAAWSQSPLDAALALQAAPLLTGWPQAARAAMHVARFARQPGDAVEYARLAASRDHGRIKEYLDSRLQAEQGNLFWVRLAMSHALADMDQDWAEALAALLAAWGQPLLAALAGADAALTAGEGGRALEILSLVELPDVLPDVLMARRAALALGSAEGFRRWLEAEPWNPTPLLLASEALRQTSGQTSGQAPTASPPESVAVLLYTFNKARDIDATLDSLAASDLGQARLAVLDNGSTDDTAQVLEGWRGRLGPQRLEIVSLPVNVGAPAARNWLAALPLTRGADFAVYLDDDVELPRDWLGLLVEAERLYPDAGVWGARVVDHAAPVRIQSADTFLLPEPEEQAKAPGARRFALSDCHHQTLDMGQFGYVRPCATVTGCCHMFRTGRLLAQGGFDLRYSPTQYDDLDHDVRLLLAGLTPVYQGRLRVRHFKSTGSQGGEGQAQWGLGWANQYKLHQKFEAADFRRAAATAQQAALEDLRARREALEQAP
ncbi:glycosyltransferase [Fundidesulfovibrio soli]|uniref:glycosyltransferase n=1 Tax=Fundidesulfovibrio soli TaxID=2922716 RepID=UPI001FAF8BC7|nr:glycosyltransferase [Fundidesulfovibrio soli]